MDLSMILSAPVAEDDEQEQKQEEKPQVTYLTPYSTPYSTPYAPYRSSSTPPPARRWNSDEVECAVAILHDFQAPDQQVEHVEAPAPYFAIKQETSGAPTAFKENDAHYLNEPQREPRTHYDNDSEEEEEQEELKPPPPPASSVEGLWGNEDVMSKLDLLVQADAAIKTGRAPSPVPLGKKKKHMNGKKEKLRTTVLPVDPVRSTTNTAALRSGVWTRAEEEYAAALMYYFLRGELGPEVVREGTTLRKFLADMLGCNRRRVSMKLATEAIAGRKVPRKVGASVFVASRPQVGRGRAEEQEEEEAEAMRATLAELRRRCFSGRAGDHDDLYHHHNHHDRERSGSEHYPPYHGEPLEEILDRPPQYGENSLDAALHGSTSDDEEFPRKRRVRRAVEPFSPSAPPSHPTTSKTKNRKGKKGKGHPTIIRTGFESQEEEEYVTNMVEFFLEGALALPEGTPLVSYLCEQLKCTPRALSLKLAPRHHGERKFPDNMDTITFTPRFQSASPTVKAETWEEMASDDDISDEIFEVESRLRELRVACLAAHDKHKVAASSMVVVRSAPRPTPPTQHHPSRSSSRPAARSNARSTAPTSFSRSGAWSREEEEYTAALIDRFFKGTLEIAEGTTLRAFLASKLQCNPMRVSKKLASECIADVKIPKKLGSSTFVRQRHAEATEEGDATHHHENGDASLRELERAYQRVDSAKHMVVAGLKSPPVRGRRRKLPLSPLALSSSSPVSSRTLFDSEDERRSPYPHDRYASPSSDEDEDERVGGKARRTDYSRSPAAEAARQMSRQHHQTMAVEGSDGLEGSDGGAAAFEARIVPLSLREQVA